MAIIQWNDIVTYSNINSRDLGCVLHHPRLKGQGSMVTGPDGGYILPITKLENSKYSFFLGEINDNFFTQYLAP